jgi:hypothetical protein
MTIRIDAIHSREKPRTSRGREAHLLFGMILRLTIFATLKSSEKFSLSAGRAVHQPAA